MEKEGKSQAQESRKKRKKPSVIFGAAEIEGVALSGWRSPSPKDHEANERNISFDDLKSVDMEAEAAEDEPLLEEGARTVLGRESVAGWPFACGGEEEARGAEEVDQARKAAK